MPYQVSWLNLIPRLPKRGMIPRGSVLWNNMVRPLTVDNYLKLPLVPYAGGIRESIINTAYRSTIPTFENILFDCWAFNQRVTPEIAASLGFSSGGINPSNLWAALNDEARRPLLNTNHNVVFSKETGRAFEFQQLMCRFGVKWATLQPISPEKMIGVFQENISHPNRADETIKSYVSFALAFHPECFAAAYFARAELTALTIKSFLDSHTDLADPGFILYFLAKVSERLSPKIAEKAKPEFRDRFIYRVARLWADASGLPELDRMKLITPLRPRLYPDQELQAQAFSNAAFSFWQKDTQQVSAPEVYAGLRFLTHVFERVRTNKLTECLVELNRERKEALISISPSAGFPKTFVGSMSPSTFHDLSTCFGQREMADSVLELWNLWCPVSGLGISGYTVSAGDSSVNIAFDDMKTGLPKLEEIPHDPEALEKM